MPTFFLSQGTPRTQLYTGVYGAGTATFSTLGPTYPSTYNALGFDPVNNYLYAVILGGNHLLQIDSNAGVTDLGAITGLPVSSNAPSNGAFDDSGNYWVTAGNGSTTAYEINVTSTPPAVIKTLTLSRAWQPIDFSFASGFMWGLSGTTIYRMNLTTGTVTTFAAPSGIVSGNFGAAWTFSNGNLGFSNNGTGDIYQVSVTNPASSSPTFSVISHYTGPVAGSSNDGAACIAADVDLGITKTGPAQVAPGGAVTWTLTVTNHGPGNSSGFVVNDTVPSAFTNVASPTPGCVITGNTVRCSEGALSSGATFTITITATAPATAGTCLTNTATVFGNENDPNSANDSSSAQTCVLGLQIVKSASVASFSAPGTPITYTYKVTNPSTVTLNPVTVTDDQLGPITCPRTSLAAGASMTCTASYTTTQADVDAGGITNVATVTGKPPSGATLTDQSTVTVPATQTPAITLAKSADTSSFSQPGTKITYSYKVTNSGNVTLDPVTVTDPLTGLSGISCPHDSLVPGASMTCTASYITTQADVDHGSVANTGTATGHPPSGPDVTARSSVTIPAEQSPAISLAKSALPPRFARAGTTITYEYLVTNTGNVTLDPVSLTDSKLGTVTCPQTALAPGASMICHATYQVTADDVDAGSVTNTATATGQPPSGGPVHDTDTTTVPVDQSPAIGLAKTPDTTSFTAPGTTITYTYLVTNSGNVTLRGISLTDDKLGSVTCPATSLPAGASMTCTASYTTTQADVDNGGVSNTAAVTGTTLSGQTVTASASARVPASQLPSIKVTKSASPARFSAAGTVITYSYLVTNSGNVTLNPVTLTDNRLGPVSCPHDSLAPGASMTCTASYTTTQADVDAGGVANTATATGTPPSGDPVRADSPLTVPADQDPAITVKKTASPDRFAAPGTTITYTYVITNSGNVTLDPVALSDDKLGPVTCPDTSLAPGASTTCTASYTTTQADLDHGSIVNTGTASGTAPDGQVVTGQSSATVTADQEPAITLKKTASYTDFAAAGTTITYRYLIVNTGNVTLDPVRLTDDRLGTITCPDTSLAAGALMVCTADYTTTQADVDAGGISNTATTTGTAPDGSTVTDDSALTIPATRDPAITVDKTADVPSFSAAGTVITYSYVVTNTGNLTLDPVTLTDSQLGPVTCPDTSLAPGARMTCTATHTTTTGDVDAGGITNTATATGQPPTGPAVDGTDTVTVPAEQAPAIGIGKSASPDSFSAPGTVITYTYLVTNSGNVTLDPVTVTDDQLGTISCPHASLAAGDQMTCTATHTTTQADVDAGGIANTATATGTPPTGPAVSDDSSATVTADQEPAISLKKTASPTTFDAAGTTITYTYLVTNTGNVTLRPVTVTDPLPGLSAVTCPGAPPIITLAPGASVTCTATYTTTQADVDAGGITNTATDSGSTPAGNTVTDQSSADVTADQHPHITIVKSASPDSFSEPGTVITYRYRVTNTGNVTLDPVTVTDDRLGAVTCPDTSLAPGDHTTCTADYTTTQADVDGGGIRNTGTATGTPPAGPEVTDSSSLTVHAIQKPAISIVKSADASGFRGPGTTITYGYLVTNTGNVTLDHVTVTDHLPGLSKISCPATTLAAGESMNCTATYTTTQADVDAGSVRNTGHTAGTAPDGAVVTDSSPHVVPALQAPAIAVVKSASPASFTKPGTTITYTYKVTNTGNLTLHPVRVIDTRLGAISCPRDSLAPGASMTCTAHYTTTAADVTRGSIPNTALAGGRAPNGVTVTARSSVVLPFTGTPPKPPPPAPPAPLVPPVEVTG